jgi:flagellar basal-body rod protein FlgF
LALSTLIDVISITFIKWRRDCFLPAEGRWSLRRHPKMDPLLISAASGMKARMAALDMLANNIANSGTTGFKADREFSGLYEQHLPMVETQWTDFSQGSMVETGNPLNLALSGKGMFALNAPSGVVYSRTGDFRVSKTDQIETPEGYTVRNVLDQGRPITVDPAQPIDISKDGTVSQGGQDLGQIQVDSPDSTPQWLSKLGSSYFLMGDASTPVPKASQNTEVFQGRVEQSNVSVSESAVKLVGVMRQFEMLQKAMNISSDMSKRAIEEVAKVA